VLVQVKAKFSRNNLLVVSVMKLNQKEKFFFVNGKICLDELFKFLITSFLVVIEEFCEERKADDEPVE
jgi:hypothetical protein